MFLLLLLVSSSLSLSLSSCYHQHFMLCAIGLYMYCRRRNTNDCSHLYYNVITLIDYYVFIVYLLCRNEICDPAKNITMCPMCASSCGYWGYHESCTHVSITRAFDNNLTFFFAVFISLWGQCFTLGQYCRVGL